MGAVKNNGRKRVAIAHKRLAWGGSERRVLWGIEALKDKYDVTLLTAGDVHLARLNEYHGTNLQPRDFEVRQAPLPFFLKNNGLAAAVRGSIFQRFCRGVSDEFDILLSAYGPMDFGRPAIHFIPDFSWCDRIRDGLHPYPPGLFYKKGVLREAYLAAARGLSDPSDRDLFSGEDQMVAVSPWVAQVMQEEFGVTCGVLESPVLDVPGNNESPVRQNGFVCLGRIAPEKRIEKIIEIIKGVRNLGHNMRLHIIGEITSSAYGKFVDRLCTENASWVVREGCLWGSAKAKILRANRFGIHACEGDAFPGAVIEMMKAGCIPWVHNSGGQTDLVRHELLTYDNVPEAVSKIDSVLGSEPRRRELKAHVLLQASRFSVQAFIVGFRRLVDEWGDRYAC